MSRGRGCYSFLRADDRHLMVHENSGKVQSALKLADGWIPACRVAPVGMTSLLTTPSPGAEFEAHCFGDETEKAERALADLSGHQPL